MIEWIRKRYIPVCSRQATRIIKDANEGKEVKPYWNMRGRERLILHNESYARYQNVMHGISTCANKSTMKEILKRAKANKASNSGNVLLGSKAEVSRQTFDRYHKEVAIECVKNGEGTIVMTPKLQSDHRRAALNSVLPMVSFLMTVLTTNLVPKSEFENHSSGKKNLEMGPKNISTLMGSSLTKRS